MATVTVIIPAFNRPQDLTRCLHSLCEQTFKDFEVLVCDDGSTVDLSGVIDTFSKKLLIRYFKSDNFGGPAKPRNLGIKKAVSKYVAFLDSDDWWLPRKLELSVAYIETGLDFVYHPMILSPKSRWAFWKPKIVKTRSLPDGAFVDLLLNGNGIINSSVVMCREIALSQGGFSEDVNLIASEDYEFWLRLAKAGCRMGHISHPLGYYQLSEDSISSLARAFKNTKKILDLFEADLASLEKRQPVWASYIFLRNCLAKEGFSFEAKSHFVDIFNVDKHLAYKARASAHVVLHFVRKWLGQIKNDHS